MNELSKYKLCELYEMGSGVSTLKSSAGHGFPFASFSTIFNNYYLPETLDDLMDTSNKQRIDSSVEEGDVLMTRTSETPDELAFSCAALKDYPNATFSGFAKRLRPKEKDKVYPKYMAFYFRSPYFRKLINSYTTMTLRASFNEHIFSFLNVYLPFISDQVRVGDFLYAIEEKIRLNNRINDNLQQLLGLLYERWFYRFEFEKCEKAKVIWNSQLKRNIPIGWKVQNMAENELFSIISSGVTPFGRKTYYATADVNGYSIGEGSEIDYETRESRANMQPYLNSIWFAKMKNSVKHLYLNRGMIDFIDSSILSTGFYGLKCNDTSFEYIASVVSAPIFEATKDRLSHGATQQGISDDDMRNMLLLVPDKETLARYHNATKHMYASISKNLIENKKLSKLRDFLLPLLMNGQATITD